MGKTKITLTKEDWLKIGLIFFSLEGVNGLKIERLAKELGVAKSSFYWHFKDREDLLNQLLDFWIHEYTEVVTSNQHLLKMAPEDRLRTIMTMVYDHQLAGLDLSFRAWGNINPIIKDKVDSAIKQRLDFTKQAFYELGFRGEALEARTRLFVAYESNERGMFDDSIKNTKLYRSERLAIYLNKL